MCARARRLPSEERRFALAAVVGGVLMAIGAFLPWLTLYAGLHPLRGVIGLNGRFLVAGGALCLVAGVRGWLRPTPGVRWVVALLGGAFAGFGVWLIVQLLITYHHLRANPMLVPRLGPALFIAVAGATAAGTTPARALGRRGTPHATHSTSMSRP